MTRSLRAMVEGDCHQEVLTFLLSRLKEGIKAKEPSLRAMIEDRVREQGGRVLGWAIGGSIATKVLLAAGQELERIDRRIRNCVKALPPGSAPRSTALNKTPCAGARLPMP